MNQSAVRFLMVAAPALAICLALLGIETIHANLLGWFLFLTGIIYAAGVVIVAYLRRERFWESQDLGQIVQEERGDCSFWLITLGLMSVFYLSPLEYLFIAEWLGRTIWMQTAGMVLVALGGALFAWARYVLRLEYSGHVSVKQAQGLIQHGPYRFIRHPAYAGYLLMALGVAIGYSSLAGLAAILVFLFPSLAYRIKVEERFLFEHFGEAYRRYVNMTKRLVPGIW